MLLNRHFVSPIVVLTLPLLLLAFGTRCCRADVVPGVDWYVRNAESILLVRVSTKAETKKGLHCQSQSTGVQRLIVEEVLKGVVFDCCVTASTTTLKPGQRAVLLNQYEHPSHYVPHIETRPPSNRKIVVWPIDADGMVSTGRVPRDSSAGFSLSWGATVGTIRRDIAASTPEEVGLCDQVVMACVLPDRWTELKSNDRRRATYVRFYTAIRDLDRDVVELAKLVASNDHEIASGAEQRLHQITEATISRWSKEKDNIGWKRRPPARVISEWNHWWEKHRDQLFWNESKQKWLPAKGAPPSRAWPSVPKDLKLPDTQLPNELSAALRDRNEEVFSKAFRSWLDSGVMRERQIALSQSLDNDFVRASNLVGWQGGSGPRLPPAPRLRMSTIFGEATTSVEDRLKLLFLTSAYWNYERFRAERLKAMGQIKQAPPGSEMVRRAAFWELRDVNISTVGRAALHRMANSDATANQRQLAAQFLSGVDDDLLGAAKIALRNRHESFAEQLFRYVQDHDDKTAHRAIRWLVYFWHRNEMVDHLLMWHEGDDLKDRKKAKAHIDPLNWGHVPKRKKELFRKAGIPSGN